MHNHFFDFNSINVRSSKSTGQSILRPLHQQHHQLLPHHSNHRGFLSKELPLYHQSPQRRTRSLQQLVSTLCCIARRSLCSCYELLTPIENILIRLYLNGILFIWCIPEQPKNPTYLCHTRALTKQLHVRSIGKFLFHRHIFFFSNSAEIKVS